MFGNQNGASSRPKWSSVRFNLLLFQNGATGAAMTIIGILQGSTKRRSESPFRGPETSFWATLSFISSIVDQRSRRYERLFAATILGDDSH